MAAYEFIALDRNGRQEKGTREADSSRQVRQQLREQGWTPLSVDPVTSPTPGRSDQGFLSGLSLQRGMSALDLATLTRQLATLIQASMPVEEALLAVAEQQEKKFLKTRLMAVRSRVLEGYTLARSLEAFPGAFPEMYRATVAAGEKSGFLDRVLSQLADYTENRMSSIQKARQALIYPMVLILASLTIVSFLMGFVVPDIIKVFMDTGQELPAITRLLVSASEIFQSYWSVMLGAVALSLFLIRKVLQKPAIRLRFDKYLLKLPVVGRYSKTLSSARFASTLSILTRSGVPLVDALVIASQVVSNLAIRQSVDGVAQSVSEGSSLYKALKSTGHFPPLMLHMINSGESTGELDTMLERTAQSQQMELDSRTAIVLGLFEPLMLVVMGGVVMMIVMAILLPILNMNQLLA
ncbi:MAG: type II secretion system inner membrane protein GspF [Endozoicomonas sp.]|uniref:type II secretion system inner membrane protein GspF n=1 Tax=Endozoicomonas sp. TaxID=1892382 RepID=UPI003D9B1AC1